jgi:hypothetical protein
MNLNEFCEKHNYKLATSLPDNWDRYNNWVPSVTTILSLLIDDSFNYVLKHNSSAVKSSITQWLKNHSDAELFFKPQSGITQCNLNVIKFHSYYNAEIIWTEVNYVKDISGTIDLVCSINWKKYNVDYKHASYKSVKYFLQLMWYKYLNWYDWMLVYIKWKLQVIEVTNEYYDVFIELKDYFLKLLNERKNTTTL